MFLIQVWVLQNLCINHIIPPLQKYGSKRYISFLQSIGHYERQLSQSIELKQSVVCINVTN